MNRRRQRFGFRLGRRGSRFALLPAGTLATTKDRLGIFRVLAANNDAIVVLQRQGIALLPIGARQQIIQAVFVAVALCVTDTSNLARVARRIR